MNRFLPFQFAARQVVCLFFYLSAVFLPTCLWAQSAPDFSALVASGVALYQKGDYLKAAEAFETVIAQDANHAEAYYYLGLIYKDLGRNIAEVAWYFKMATDIKPDYVAALDHLGKVYYGLGQFQKAEDACLKILKINPNYLGAALSLGWIALLGKSNPTEAIDYFHQVLASSEIPQARFGLGMAYFMRGDRAQVLDAITHLRHEKQEKFAAQLEDMVRGYHYVPKPAPGPLVDIPVREIEPAAAQLIPSGDNQPQNSGQLGSPEPQPVAGSSRVQLRGRMVDLPAEPQGAHSAQPFGSEVKPNSAAPSPAPDIPAKTKPRATSAVPASSIQKKY